MIVASYNVHKCRGADGLFRPDRIAAVIAELGADVVAIQEADRRFGRRIGLLDVMHLRQKSGLVLVPDLVQPTADLAGRSIGVLRSLEEAIPHVGAWFDATGDA